jgi:peptidoglycan/LPS O-acetylase OafA/YrhL
MALMDNRIRGFDGLRAIAVLMVFLQHRVLSSRDETGHLGVWIFFALSGYLITGILSAQRRTIEKGASDFFAELKRFLFRRTLRIFPIYYLLLAVMAVLMMLGHASPQLKGGLPFHFAYLSNIWIGEVLRYWPGTWSHLWSLSIEEQFYLFFAPLLLLMPIRWHLLVCYAIFVTGVVSVLLMRDTGTPEIVIYTHPLTNFWMLALFCRGSRASSWCCLAWWCCALPSRTGRRPRTPPSIRSSARSTAYALRPLSVRLHAAAVRFLLACWKRPGWRHSAASVTASICTTTSCRTRRGSIT